MKSKTSLSLLIVALCAFALFQPRRPKERVPDFQVQSMDHTALDCALNLFPGRLHLTGCACTFSRRIHRISRNAKNAPMLLALDQPPDDESQADDDSSNDTDFALAYSEPCPRPAEWRRTHPDTQFANTFINSKSKPPP